MLPALTLSEGGATASVVVMVSSMDMVTLTYLISTLNRCKHRKDVGTRMETLLARVRRSHPERDLRKSLSFGIPSSGADPEPVEGSGAGGRRGEVSLVSLVPKLHLGTHLLRQFHCRSRSRAREGVVHRLTAAATSQREMEFREEQEAFPNEIWERGKRSKARADLDAHQFRVRGPSRRRAGRRHRCRRAACRKSEAG